MKVAIAISLTTLFVARPSLSDSGRAAPPSLPHSLEEPTSERPADSVNGQETRPRDPFSLYEIGEPGTKVLRYEDLSPSDKVQLSLGRNAGMAAPTVDAYGAAVRDRARQAAGRAAAQKLGLEHLELIGVVR